MSNKSFPPDWDDTSTLPRGVTKNNQARCYNVRINVQGKQLHVATSNRRESASRFYDIALWKFCPKMRAKSEPNEAEWFSYITQNTVEANVPRLNRLYDETPFLSHQDSEWPEESLRQIALDRTKIDKDESMADYDKAVAFLGRAVVELADLEAKLANRMGKLTKLHKLSGALSFRQHCEAVLFESRCRVEGLKNSLQAQRPYYQTQLDKQ